MATNPIQNSSVNKVTAVTSGAPGAVASGGFSRASERVHASRERSGTAHSFTSAGTASSYTGKNDVTFGRMV